MEGAGVPVSTCHRGIRASVEAHPTHRRGDAYFVAS
jgi:hypothetical protein